MIRLIISATLVAGAFYLYAMDHSPWMPDQDPLGVLRHDRVLICITPGDDRAGRLIMDAMSDIQTALTFWPSQRGQCAEFAADNVDSLALFPQHQRMFLDSARVIWSDGKTKPLHTVIGGWVL